MVARIAYNVLPVVVFGALGFGLGKTMQIIKAAKANPALYSAPNPTWVQQASPIWMIVAAVVIGAIAARYLIKRSITRK